MHQYRALLKVSICAPWHEAGNELWQSTCWGFFLILLHLPVAGPV